ncbi:cellulose synthase complex periplasmic endoglucanase BcsZ [Pantoea sp. 1.19]|uniref:cellulose synthase complex periplasmic endoglucanase BcsZ n=1 Tax=Pantoea sp. 1.19 TaxID=1925589 RepID=UPI0009489603|nr:cellulose synthase complex periplasmic endoglucanase BcsZ [Pantoea sp. 1.19]
MGRRFSGMLVALLLSSSALAACEWPLWQSFSRDYISADGRVIDPSDARAITTSEGQSYALFFALVANDRETFDRVLGWTENNLAQGDLTAHLPAWVWGKSPDGRWQVLDSNSASDADLWIAYSLLQAARLWQSRHYQVLGTLLLSRIAREEVADIPGVGPTLLPGRTGFQRAEEWDVNPSYVPLQLIRSFAALPGPWRAMGNSAVTLLTGSAPRGFSPDWYRWRRDKGWEPDAQKGPRGSYDAIRVYLWAGMLHPDDPARAALLQHFAPMRAETERAGQPPERVNVLTGEMQNRGPVGFSAALLPFMQDSPVQEALRRQVTAQLPGKDAYYSAVLTLFGLGWDHRLYRFSPQGALLPAWKEQCVNTH